MTDFHRNTDTDKGDTSVSDAAKRSTADSSMRRGSRLAAALRGAFATRASSRDAKGSGAPAARRRLALAGAIACLAALAFAPAALAAEPPVVTPVGNTPLLEAGAVGLGAYLTPRNSEVTDCHFEYGLTESYGESAPCLEGEYQPLATLADNTVHLVKAHLTGLTPGATYHARLSVTTLAGGTATSADDLVPVPGAGAAACPNEARRTEQHTQSLLPDCRAWEIVSPPDKNGANVISDPAVTRGAADGNALSFEALGGFGDTEGTDVGAEYIAERSGEAEPGGSGWSTHGITPDQLSNNGQGALDQFHAQYQGDLSPDLSRGVLLGFTPRTNDPDVAEVPNLYRRSNLLQAGPGSYDLLTACPLCAETSTPLPSLPTSITAALFQPKLAWATPDFGRVLFESRQPLTADTPASPGCEPATSPRVEELCRIHVYEAGPAGVSLLGRVPVRPATECDDSGAPACAPADLSLAGMGTGVGTENTPNLALDALSDGSDGHSRAFFTQPTNAAGQTSEEEGNSPEINKSREGRIFMRVDGHRTVQIDATERTSPVAFKPSTFLEASRDGERAFFMTKAALTDLSPSNTAMKLYMYDVAPHSELQQLKVSATAGTFNLTFAAQTTPDLPYDATAAQVQAALEALSTIGAGNIAVSGGPGDEAGSAPYSIEFAGALAGKPQPQIAAANGATPLSGGSGAAVTTLADGGHLTLITVDHEPSDGFNFKGLIGVSADGRYAYLISAGQLAAGAPRLGGEWGIYLWHDGDLSFITVLKSPDLEENVSLNSGLKPASGFRVPQSRVSPDGLHLIFATNNGQEILTSHGAASDFNHSNCLGTGCRELYYYDAATSTLSCATCDTGGAATLTTATDEEGAAMASDSVDEAYQHRGGAGSAWHRNQALSADGRYVFFSTAEALVPEDTDGAVDAYVYDTETNQVHLLSSGTSSKDSFFLEASPDGRNAFFSTAQRLLGWDSDSINDVYDARVEGGFPEPPATTAPCDGDSCRSAAPLTPGAPPAGSAGFTGPGNPAPKHHGRKHRRKRRHHARRHHHKRANTNRRTSR